jgi:hypothetical protein
MTRIFGPGRIAAALIVAVALGLSSAASAQEPTEAQLDAARAAISAIHATDDFDTILPNAAEALKHSLIQAEPNLQAEISTTVDQQALKLAARRADLEKQVATIYAKLFTADELKAIAAFYNTEAGKKLIKQAPAITRETMQAARIWSNGIARDLADATHKALEAQLAKANGGKAPAAGKTPAAGSGSK